MDDQETPLEKAKRSVAEAEARVADQVALIAELEAKGLDTEQAKAVLEVFKNTLRIFVEDLAEEQKRAGQQPPP